MKVGDIYISSTDYHIKIYTIVKEVPGIGWGYDKIWHKIKEDKTETIKYGVHKSAIAYDDVAGFLMNKNRLDEMGNEVKDYDKIALLLLIGD
jgi:hypothetical protein